MNISINKPFLFICKNLLHFIPRSLIFFFIAFIISSILIPIVTLVYLQDSIGLVMLFSLIGPLVYLAIQTVDLYLLSKSTYVELDDDKISVYASGFKTVNVTFKLSDVQAVNVTQVFMDKIFGLSMLHIRQISGLTQAYGFNIEDARKVASRFSKIA